MVQIEGIDSHPYSESARDLKQLHMAQRESSGSEGMDSTILKVLIVIVGVFAVIAEAMLLKAEIALLSITFTVLLSAVLLAGASKITKVLGRISIFHISPSSRRGRTVHPHRRFSSAYYGSTAPAQQRRPPRPTTFNFPDGRNFIDPESSLHGADGRVNSGPPHSPSSAPAPAQPRHATWGGNSTVAPSPARRSGLGSSWVDVGDSPVQGGANLRRSLPTTPSNTSWGSGNSQRATASQTVLGPDGEQHVGWGSGSN